MAQRVPVLDEYYFKDGRRRLTRLARKGGISKAGENRIAREGRKAIELVLKQVVDDVRTVYRRSGNAYNVMRYGGIRVTGSTLSNLRAQILGPSYIRALEEGTTIKPTTSRYLAIPIFEALRPDKTPKLPSPRSWRNIKKTFVYTSKDGRKFIAYNEQGKLKIIYVLVDEVEMPRIAALRQAYDRRAGVIKAELERALLVELDRPENRLMNKARLATAAVASTRGRR